MKLIDIVLGKFIIRPKGMKGTFYNLITTVFVHINHFTNTTTDAEWRTSCFGSVILTLCKHRQGYMTMKTWASGGVPKASKNCPAEIQIFLESLWYIRTWFTTNKPVLHSHFWLTISLDLVGEKTSIQLETKAAKKCWLNYTGPEKRDRDNFLTQQIK